MTPIQTALRAARKVLKTTTASLVRAEIEGTTYPNLKPGNYTHTEVIKLLQSNSSDDVKQFARDFMAAGISLAVVDDAHKVASTEAAEDDEEDLDEDEEEAEDLLIPAEVVDELLAIDGVEDLLRAHGVLD